MSNAMFKISYGLYVLTARDGEKDNGCIINAVNQITSEPNRIAIAVNKSNYTHDMIMKDMEFNISVLSEKASFDAFKHWGFQSGRSTDKTAQIKFSRAENGIIYIAENTNAYMSAIVYECIDCGTHTLFLAYVTHSELLSDDKSATYEFYQKNIKPAPAREVKKGFICTVCGYIYEGDTLPDDFICPLCKHPASDFSPLEA